MADIGPGVIIQGSALVAMRAGVLLPRACERIALEHYEALIDLGHAEAQVTAAADALDRVRNASETDKDPHVTPADWEAKIERCQQCVDRARDERDRKIRKVQRLYAELLTITGTKEILP